MDNLSIREPSTARCRTIPLWPCPYGPTLDQQVSVTLGVDNVFNMCSESIWRCIREKGLSNQPVSAIAI
eukprot:3763917-Amphidinium_carterae.1